MTAVSPIPLAPREKQTPEEEAARPRRRRRRIIRGSRPGWIVYAVLGVFLLGSVFPYYWSFLIGSGDSSTIRDPNMSWLPGGNFLANAASVVNASIW